MAERDTISLDAKGRPYIPAVAPALRRLLWVIIAAAALLGASGIYLGSITAMGEEYQSVFYFWILLVHIVAGAAITLPFVAFGLLHMRAAVRRPNRRAVRAGLALFGVSNLTIAAGFLLVKRDLGEPWNGIAYWTHVLAPVAGVALYIAHRLAGPAIHWRWGGAWAGSVAAFVSAMALLHLQDPRRWNLVGPAEGDKYFQPSLARTATGGFIPADVLDMDEYCLRCHSDAYSDWYHSAHHFSSFNNPAYRFSVRETRRVAFERDGNTRAARWCAGCHDPVPFLSGEFDNPDYDDVNAPSAQAGITCTTCHAITNVNSTRGNGDYTIEEPLHYPFAASKSPFLQWVNNQLVKAKPAFHKKTFLKPLHKTAELCSACHKVHLPYELTRYKEFLRGQNHYDTYLLSGASGHGARSFYYPPQATANCAESCHMPPRDSRDFGHRSGKTHNHLFPGANTGLAELRGHEPTREAQAKFLSDGILRLDLFGLRRGGSIDGEMLAPLRPELPVLERGATYLLDVVLRTLRMGHHFTQGTVDSNEVWVDIEVRSAGRELAKSGAIDPEGRVDPWAHFVNVLMLDRNGERIDRRNAQDIYTPLYNHQIPPGAADTVHYRLVIPEDAGPTVEVSARLLYRKFDRTFMEHVFGKDAAPNLKPVVLCQDRIVLAVAPAESPGASAARAELPDQPCSVPAWQRWNDFGIGLLLKGDRGAEKGELRQAEQAFHKVAELGRADGWVNLARVYEKEGRLDDAARALQRAVEHPEPAPPWVVAWLSARVKRQNALHAEAVRDLEAVLATRVPERGFDFSQDYLVRNELGQTLFELSRRLSGEESRQTLERARRELLATLSLDAENLAAHKTLQQVAAHLGDKEAQAFHGRQVERYRDDDDTGSAQALYRSRHPAANRAAQSIVIYDLGAAP